MGVELARKGRLSPAQTRNFASSYRNRKKTSKDTVPSIIEKIVTDDY